MTDQARILDDQLDHRDRRSDQAGRRAELRRVSPAGDESNIQDASALRAPALTKDILIFVKTFFNCEGRHLDYFGHVLTNLFKIDDDDHVFPLHDHPSGACEVRSPIRLIPKVKEISQKYAQELAVPWAEFLNRKSLI